MAKKLSYADLSTERERLSLRAHILEIACTEMADDTFRYRDGRDAYMWRAYRLAGCAGGYLTCVYDGFTNDKKSIIYVERLDTAIEQIQHRASTLTGNGMAEATSRFNSARYNLLNQVAS